jgi:hypothetical protein
MIEIGTAIKNCLAEVIELVRGESRLGFVDVADAAGNPLIVNREWHTMLWDTYELGSRIRSRLKFCQFFLPWIALDNSWSFCSLTLGGHLDHSHEGAALRHVAGVGSS